MFFRLASFQAWRISAIGTPRFGHAQLVFVFRGHLTLVNTWLLAAFGASGPIRGRTAELGSAVQAGVFVSTDQNDRPGLRFAATGARNWAILRDVAENHAAVWAEDVDRFDRWDIRHDPHLRIPMRSRTCSMVSLNNTSACRLPSTRTSRMTSGFWANCILRSRNSASMWLMLSARTRLQSMQPIPADMHPSLLHASCSGVLTYWWRAKMQACP